MQKSTKKCYVIRDAKHTRQCIAFFKKFWLQGNIFQRGPNDERFSGLWGRHYLLLWGTNIDSPKTVKLYRKGPKLLGNFVDIDINYKGKKWAYRQAIPCSYNVKKDDHMTYKCTLQKQYWNEWKNPLLRYHTMLRCCKSVRIWYLCSLWTALHINP